MAAKIKYYFRVALPTMAIVFGLAAILNLPAHGQNVLNNSFSLDNVTVDGGINTNVSDWTLTGNILTEVGVTENPSALQYLLCAGLTGSAPGMLGDQVLDFSTSLIGGTASASQATLVDLELNEKYTLSVSVGAPLGDVFQGYDISILAGSTTLATSGAQYGVTSGSFAAESISFTTGTSYAAFVGDPLTVELSAPDAAGLLGLQSASVDFNDVDLSVTAAVPEPSTFGLLAFCLALFVILKRRSFRARA